MKKLQLGCGPRRIPGYTNVNILFHETVQSYCGMSKARLDRPTYWTSFLKGGGMLYVSTPDPGVVVARYKKNNFLILLQS